MTTRSFPKRAQKQLIWQILSQMDLRQTQKTPKVGSLLKTRIKTSQKLHIFLDHIRYTFEWHFEMDSGHFLQLHTLSFQ